MRSLILCRERLLRILFLLDRNDGQLSLRIFMRNHGVFSWELEQAAELGWLRVIERKPSVGRPSHVAKKVSKNESAKLPPWRYAIPIEISIRHWRFALESVSTMSGGYFGFKPATLVHAYMQAFPMARSRTGASASANRLMKRLDVKMMRKWLYLSGQGKINEPMPTTLTGIVRRLQELGLL